MVFNETLPVLLRSGEMERAELIRAYDADGKPTPAMPDMPRPEDIYRTAGQWDMAMPVHRDILCPVGSGWEIACHDGLTGAAKSEYVSDEALPVAYPFWAEVVAGF